MTSDRRPSRPLLLGCLLLSALLASCADSPLPGAPLPPPALAKGEVSLVTHGWHTDIALPATEASGPLARFRQIFPGASTLVFGYGKRTFMIAPAHTLGEWIIGPFPGPAAIEVSAISGDPVDAYGASHVITLPLPPGGAKHLSDFLWAAIAKDGTGTPLYIATGNWPGSQFYAASQGYALNHTCNRWSAEALAAGGLPVSPQGVVFSGSLDSQVRQIQRRPAGS
ncbi:DUF2459 domain-containing protein [Acidisoma cellulosilytica]|uniref:DUF2459 domain-containing protein n=1 Tax=Acidisoma cellulosilyticum TaxID=2802395 RepID=A0A963Z0U0_9PROT|nr:DUF2459 domain-containing protein [Acidisoma cellulosilyticum]MCB8879927.1 DUF2459 domain-containing protein [Acidisoma cellulosilyticum]